jgi:hypothetical protein
MRFIHVIMPYKNTREIDRETQGRIYGIFLYRSLPMIHRRLNYETEGENHPVHILLKTLNVDYKHIDY